jgi:cyclomaltodextrinase / maltogenic alpha-amylase / neopullulanase
MVWLACKLDYSLCGSASYLAGPIYQILPDRFYKSPAHSSKNSDFALEPWESKPTVHGFKGGDLWGIAAKLDHIAALGIQTLYLNPVFLSPANHRYHTQDYFTIDPLLGGEQAFIHLQQCLKAKGMSLWLDGVFNHGARSHFAFASLMECGKKSPYLDWFCIKGFPLRAYSKKPNYECWWGLPALPKWNTKKTAVREHLMQAALYWVQKGIDGWRLDVPNEIDDDAFWLEMVARCKNVNPETVFVGEIWDHPARWLQDGMFEGVTHYRMYRLLRKYFCGEACFTHESLSEFAQELKVLLEDTPRVLQQINLLGSHDTMRIATAIYDQRLLRGLYALLFFLPGVPLVFAGDEIAMEGGKDPDCRRAFEWNTQKWKQDLTKDLRYLSSLRKKYGDLFSAEFELAHQGGVFVIQRKAQTQLITLIWNICGSEVGFYKPDGSLLALKSTEFAIIEPVI